MNPEEILKPRKEVFIGMAKAIAPAPKPTPITLGDWLFLATLGALVFAGIVALIWALA